ncbi:protein of unknown function [Candidatus Promineifilum breve]|uniref:Uncharacterized protein n=1 Tax=Candidatus Promineifilum breve TaxID=1806508 RepID=A0A160T852_9CHLR|nr:protein of unknown function [Candidatus Promineifilum breve]
MTAPSRAPAWGVGGWALSLYSGFYGSRGDEELNTDRTRIKRMRRIEFGRRSSHLFNPCLAVLKSFSPHTIR